MPRPPKNDRYSVFALTEIERGHSIWDRVGVAYVNRDESITVHLRAVPLSGKLQLRRPEEEDNGEPRPAEEGRAA